MKNLKTSIALLSVLALAVGATAMARTTSGSSRLGDAGTTAGMAGMHMAMHAASSASRVVEGSTAAHHARPSCSASTPSSPSRRPSAACRRRGLPGARQAARRELGRDLEGDRFGLRLGRGQHFLNGKNLWRAHINDFVNYTVATAKKDPAGQKKAVDALMAYIQTQAAFFAKATGLPKKALVNDLTAHVLQLKGQLDAYAAGNYAQAYQLANGAYEHMFMTGDLLASAIAKQKHLGSTTSPSADLEITLDRLLGEHALLATWATQAGLGGGKNFPALAKQLDANSRRDLEGDRFGLRLGRGRHAS